MVYYPPTEHGNAWMRNSLEVSDSYFKADFWAAEMEIYSFKNTKHKRGITTYF